MEYHAVLNYKFQPIISLFAEIFATLIKSDFDNVW